MSAPAGPGAQLAGVRALLGADAVLVGTWIDDGHTVLVHAGDPAALRGMALPMDRDALRRAGGARLDEGDVPWARSTALAAALAGAWSAGLVVAAGTSTAGAGALPEGVVAALWHDASAVPSRAAARAVAARPLLDDIVRAAASRADESRAGVRLAALLATVPEGIVLTDEEAGTALVNDAAAALLGLEPGAVAAATLAAAMHALQQRCSEPALLAAEGAALFATADAARTEWVWEVTHPAPRSLMVGTLPVRSPWHRGRLWTFHDVTERRRQESELALALAEAKRERERLRAIVDTLPVGVWIADATGHLEYVNRAATDIWRDEGRRPRHVGDDVGHRARHADTGEYVREEEWGLARVLRGEPPVVAEPIIVERMDGTTAYALNSAVALRDDDGRIAGGIAVLLDVTALREVEAERERLHAERESLHEVVRESEHRFRLAMRATRDVVWDWDLVTDALVWSEGLAPTFGHAPAALATGDAWTAHIHPEDAERVTASIEAVLQAGESAWSGEYRFRRADGAWAVVSDFGSVVRDAAGRATRMIGAMQDQTARRALEAQLRQSQKMEAVGRLAGGIAHDFNNLLTVIGANVDFLLADLPPGTQAHDDANEVREAASRASALTRQLLAFSRKQVLQPRVVELDEVVHGVTKLLRRVIGEDVRLSCSSGAPGATVLADPGQLEQALLNLAVNARDAMPEGGALEIRTMPATDAPVAAPLARDHVLLAVTDTGHGMDADTVSRAFEPFFTTKEAGKGTGLGLATVYGIVEQTGGATWIESEPGLGTTVWIALPLARGTTEAASPRPASRHAGHGTVLVVEDEERVRALTARVLAGAGYDVLAARNGVDALALWESHGGAAGAIVAVVTDVVMPELGGAALVRRLRRERRDLPVVFVSGYAEGGLAADDLGGRTAFVQKPFDGASLLGAIEGLGVG